MSSRSFTTLAIDDVYSITIVQQCHMLQALLATVCQCLEHPDDAIAIVQSNKKLLHDHDFELLLSSVVTSRSVEPIVANFAELVSWKKIWDGALDYGFKGTTRVQVILSRPSFVAPHQSYHCGYAFHYHFLYFCVDTLTALIV